MAMSDVVRIEHEAAVAVVLIDEPPVNAATRAVRSGLLSAIESARRDPGVDSVVIMGAGTTFIAGADLREFGRPIAEPSLPAVIEAIEACPKPVVAALQGAALGGGLELALGCDARVAQIGTVLGLPEVTLGLIPGAGGTQRLPRLIGVTKAIGLICSGERLSAEQALSLGIVDQVVTTDLRQQAIVRALALEGRKARVRERAVPSADEVAVAAATASALRAGKGRPAVRVAIDAVLAAQSLPIDVALAQERAAFQALRVSREAHALRHLFFAEREASKVPGLERTLVRPVQRVAVIGAGTMGGGIAIVALDAGFEVVLLEQDAAALGRGRDRIRQYYDERVKAGKLEATKAAERTARLQPSLDWSHLAQVDLLIEAVFEDLAIKQEVLRRMDQVARGGAILASNTSYLDLDALANTTSRPQDVVGLHFFSPAPVMRLLEIVRGVETAPDVLATCLHLARAWRKVAVVAANAFGFIGNRIYAAYRRQCEFMLEEGASPQQVDAALETFGFAMGPFAVADLSGLDIAWRMRQSRAAQRDPKARYVLIPDRLCEAGRLGRKSGAGYYYYEASDPARQVDPAVQALIERIRSAQGIVARALGDEEIARRALLSMVNEAALLLQERVAQRADDIDVVLVNGYGFPKWEGGPVFWARERGRPALEQDLDWLAGLSGPGFVRASSLELLAARAET
jgi:3-hydroxyacyl-CoA dehydrogenase